MKLSLTFASATRQTRIIARVIVCGLLLVLPSCQIPVLHHAEPGQPLPPDFNGAASPESAAQLGVEEFFQDPVLTCLIAQALDGNQELKILEQEIRIASNDVMRRRGAIFPFLVLRGEEALHRHSLYTPLGAAEEQLTYPGDKHFPDPLNNFRLSADVFWQIDIWRELRNSRDAASQRYVAAVERRNFFVTQLVAEIANNYYELMALDQRLQVLDRIIALQQQSLRTAVLNRDAGRDTDLPVRRFQADVQKNQSEKLIVIQEIIEAENRINFLRGYYPQYVERDSANFLDLQLNALSVGVPAQLLLYRTDIRRAERELAAAGLDVQVARARFFPRLDLVGSVGYEAFDPQFLFRPDALVANAALGLVAPLINKSAIRADYLDANAVQLQAVYNYQRVVLNAFTEVVNNLAKAENFRRSVEIKRQQFASLEIAVDVANKLFLSDRAEYSDVLFSQRDLLEARTVLIQTKQQQLSAIVNAYQALGGGLLLSSSGQFAVGLGCPPPEPHRRSLFLPCPPFSPPCFEGSSSRRNANDPALLPPVDGYPNAEELPAPPVVQPPPADAPPPPGVPNLDNAAPGVPREEMIPFNIPPGDGRLFGDYQTKPRMR